MQTPEEVARAALLPPLDDPDRPDTSCTIDASEWFAYALRHAERVIRARDAEIRADERAKVLVGFEWEERHDGIDFKAFPRPRYDVHRRRLVGPWDPTEEDA